MQGDAALLFLSSGLFLGWALGANHLANVFGTAVGTRMLSWLTAAVTCSVFVVLGAVISGAGPSATLGRLGSINAIGGAFTVALAAALVMFWATRMGLPVPTTQAIVGAIIGWNIFTASGTDTGTLGRIVGAWVAGPFIAAGIAFVLLRIVGYSRRWFHPHLLKADAYTRLALWAAGAFGAYSLGANNIANVMGVFVPVSPFTATSVGDFLPLSSTQQLFFLGALAIAAGALTYSRRVVRTVGSELLSMSPLAAWIVVMAHSIVLFVFSSERLEAFLANHGLPTIPLVPMSSSVVVVGAVIGIGLHRSGRQLRWRPIGRIGVAWVVTPFLSALVCFLGLFVMQNLFHVPVFRQVTYAVTPSVTDRMAEVGLPTASLDALRGRTFPSGAAFREALRNATDFTPEQQSRAMRLAEATPVYFDPDKLDDFDFGIYPPRRAEAIRRLEGRRFAARWMVAEALAVQTKAWKRRPPTAANRRHNRQIDEGLDHLYRVFAVPPSTSGPAACPCPAGTGAAAPGAAPQPPGGPGRAPPQPQAAPGQPPP